MRVAVIHTAHTVDVFTRTAAFDLVVRLLWAGWLRVKTRPDQLNIPIQAALNTRTELVLRDVHHLGGTLCGIEVRSSKWQQDVVNRHELSAWTALLLVVPHLHVLRATHRELSKHLLLLVAVLFNLLGQLPVHVVALTLGSVSLLRRHFTYDLGSRWAIRWE